MATSGITTLTTKAQEKSTYVVTAAFKDEDGDAVTPNSGLTWTLTDESGNIINLREDVDISSASSVNIVLTGDDLKWLAGVNKWRVVTIEGTYDSTLGTGLSFRDEVRFEIENLVAVS